MQGLSQYPHTLATAFELTSSSASPLAHARSRGHHRPSATRCPGWRRRKRAALSSATSRTLGAPTLGPSVARAATAMQCAAVAAASCSTPSALQSMALAQNPAAQQPPLAGGGAPALAPRPSGRRAWCVPLARTREPGARAHVVERAAAAGSSPRLTSCGSTSSARRSSRSRSESSAACAAPTLHQVRWLNGARARETHTQRVDLRARRRCFLSSPARRDGTPHQQLNASSTSRSTSTSTTWCSSRPRCPWPLARRRSPAAPPWPRSTRPSSRIPAARPPGRPGSWHPRWRAASRSCSTCLSGPCPCRRR